MTHIDIAFKHTRRQCTEINSLSRPSSWLTSILTFRGNSHELRIPESVFIPDRMEKKTTILLEIVTRSHINIRVPSSSNFETMEMIGF